MRLSALFKLNQHLPINTADSNELEDRISEEVTEIPDSPVVQNQDQTISQTIAYYDYQNVHFGGTIPVPNTHELLQNMLVKIYRWLIRRRRSVFFLLFIIFLGYASADNKVSSTEMVHRVTGPSINYILKAIKHSQMYNEKEIEANALSTSVSFNGNWSMRTSKVTFHESCIVQPSINLSYPIVELFRYVISKLLNWKGDDTEIMHDKSYENKSILGYELKNTAHSVSNAVHALDQLLSFVKSFCTDIVNNIIEHQRSITNKYCDLEQSSPGTLYAEESDSKNDNEDFFCYNGG